MAPYTSSDGSAPCTSNVESPPSCPGSPGAPSSPVDLVITLKMIPEDECSTLELNELNPLVS